MRTAASRRFLATTATLLVATTLVAGCRPFRIRGHRSSRPGPTATTQAGSAAQAGSTAEISNLPNIPVGQKNQLVDEYNNAQRQQKSSIIDKARALNNMVGAQLVATSPVTINQQRFSLSTNGTISVNKNDKVYQMMSATDFWRLGSDTYDLCVDRDCAYYSSWTVQVEGSGNTLTYVWTMKIDGPEQPTAPIVRRFQVSA